MSTEVSVFVIFSVIQMILAQPPSNTPPECLTMPRAMNRGNCCPLPPMYTDEELQRCNYDPYGSSLQNMVEDCQKKLCLLKNRGLLLSSEDIDYEKLKLSVENWAANKTHLRRGLDIAKEICFTDEYIDDEKVSHPICESDRVFHCVTGHLVWNCDLDLEYPGCQRLQMHMDHCRKYLYVEPF